MNTTATCTSVCLGQVIMEFADIESAQKALNAMNGRRFAGRVVSARFISDDAYATARYDE